MDPTGGTVMPKIFISYRRDDTGGYAGRMYDRLAAHFGPDHLFIDVDTLEPGEDFVQAIEERVGSCDALIAVIGNKWLISTDENGRRRLDDPNDFVRLEIATALERKVRVIPALVDGASMPSPLELPECLLPLARRNALQVSSTLFTQSIELLIKSLEKLVSPSLPSRTPQNPVPPAEANKGRKSPAATKPRVEAPAVEKEFRLSKAASIDALLLVGPQWLILALAGCWAIAYGALRLFQLQYWGPHDLIPLILGAVLVMALRVLPRIKSLRVDRELALSALGIATGRICSFLFARLAIQDWGWGFLLTMFTARALGGAICGVFLGAFLFRGKRLFFGKPVLVNAIVWTLSGFLTFYGSILGQFLFGAAIGGACGWSVFWLLSKKAEK